MNLFAWLAGPPPGEAEIRAEIWRLGQRHQGRPLQGARDELAAGRLPTKQALLLRACIRQMEANAVRTRFGKR